MSAALILLFALCGLLAGAIGWLFANAIADVIVARARIRRRLREVSYASPRRAPPRPWEP